MADSPVTTAPTPATEAIFAPDALARLESAREGFAQAMPYPHLVLDGLFDPAFLRGVAASYPGGDDPRWHRFADQSREVKLQIDDDRHFPAPVAELVRTLNGAPFLRLLAEATGIPGLIPDPYFYGGGMHQILPGGKLAIHADYNLHPVMRVERRLNLLVYLNEGWEDAWGGHFEMWDRGMAACERRVAPAFNRTVVFRTDGTSYHGHPDPLACPPDRARRSVALYYYTQAAEGAESQGTGHSTLFRERPGEAFADPPVATRLRIARSHVVEAARALAPGTLKRLLKRVRG
jgi:hypothetical protein